MGFYLNKLFYLYMTALSCCGPVFEMDGAVESFKALLASYDVDEQTFAIVIAVAVVAVTIVALLIKRSRRRKRTNVLLLGISESGKTYMFSKLVAGESKEKQTL